MVEPEKVPEKKEPEKKKPESSRGKAPAAAKEVAQEAAKDGGAGDKKKGSARVEEASHRGNGQKRREPESDSLQAKAEKGMSMQTVGFVEGMLIICVAGWYPWSGWKRLAT